MLKIVSLGATLLDIEQQWNKLLRKHYKNMPINNSYKNIRDTSIL